MTEAVMERVVQERRARSTGTRVRVVDHGVQSDGGERWATVCVDHGSSRSNPTRAGAVELATYPEEWCRQCHENTGTRFWLMSKEEVEDRFGGGVVIGFPVRPGQEQVVHTFLVGGLQPIEQMPAATAPAEDDDLEFVSPSVPGRRTRIVRPDEQ